jgi:hypothetical protein
MNCLLQCKNVFDSEEIKIIQKYLKKPNWEFGYSSDCNSKIFFWVMNFENNSFFTKNLFCKIKELIKNNYEMENNYEIESVYANGQTFGLDGGLHIDSTNESSITFIYYPMENWDISWGGETIIIDSSNKENIIYPLPNSAIVFPSNWWHCGKSPSRIFNGLRTTIVYKLRVIQDKFLIY